MEFRKRYGKDLIVTCRVINRRELLRALDAGPALDAAEQLRAGVKQKIGKYGALSVPYVIAVNMPTGFGIEEYEVLNGLYGQGDTDDASLEGRRGGLFSSKHGTRVSAVVVARMTVPFGLSMPRAVLYPNPKAVRRFPFALLQLPIVGVGAKTIRRRLGRRLSEIMALPADWHGSGG